MTMLRGISATDAGAVVAVDDEPSPHAANETGATVVTESIAAREPRYWFIRLGEDAMSSLNADAYILQSSIIQQTSHGPSTNCGRLRSCRWFCRVLSRRRMSARVVDLLRQEMHHATVEREAIAYHEY